MEFIQVPWLGYAVGTMLMFGVTNSLLKYAASRKMDSISAPKYSG